MSLNESNQTIMYGCMKISKYEYENFYIFNIGIILQKGDFNGSFNKKIKLN